MLLRESFGLEEAASLIEKSLGETWRAGWRTADLAEPGCKILGTRAMTDKVAEEVLRSAESKWSAQKSVLRFESGSAHARMRA
jgi:3-isopropylmalate dehydrogenase